MTRRRAILAAIAVLLALCAGWYFGSPWWTLRQMQVAARARDAEALSAYIDYPAVREGVMAQLSTRIGVRGNVRSLEQVLAIGLARAAVDLVVSPEALRAVFLTAPAPGQGARPVLGLRASDMTVHYDGPNQFRLVRKDHREGELVFHRHGLGWKLADIQLPPEIRATPAATPDR